MDGMMSMHDVSNYILLGVYHNVKFYRILNLIYCSIIAVNIDLHIVICMVIGAGVVK